MYTKEKGFPASISIGFVLLAALVFFAPLLILADDLVEPAPVVGEETVTIETEETPAPESEAEVSSPSLSTDKEDYHPGQTATIFGKFFAPLQNFILKVFGSDDNDENYTEEIQTVVTNETGEFSATYTLDSLYRPFYEIVVSAPDGEKVAETWFRDAAIAKYDQCSNDDGDGYATGNTECRFINGNLQSNNSTYFEGDSTVQRLSIDGLAPGSVHTVTLKYGTTKAGKHAYDFLTSWNASESWSSVADRCDSIQTGCATATETTASMQDDPNVTNTIEPSGASRLFTMRGGTITNVSVPFIASGSYAGDSETIVVITYTAGPSNGSMCSTKKVQGQDVTTCAMVLWFGAHISEGAKWLAFNGTTGAGTISGSPYHVALADFDGDTTSVPSGGGRDNQMQAGAIVVVPPQNTISGVKFYDLNGNGINDAEAPLSGWTIFIDANANQTLDGGEVSTVTNGSGIYTFSSLADGTYSICEVLQAGWTKTTPAGCHSINVSGGITDSTGNDFGNFQNGLITIIKDAVPDNAQDFAFTTTGAGLNNFSLDDDANGTLSNTQVFSNLGPGAYSVTEGAQAGWALTNLVCNNQAATTNTQTGVVSIATLPSNSNISCTYTNTLQTGHIIVDKITDPAGDPQSFNFDASGGTYGDFSLTDAAAPNNQELIAGAYSVSETVPAGWDLTSATCVSSIQDSETPANLELDPGETITCTFSNTKRGHVIIQKNAVPDDSQAFTFQNNFGNDNPVSFNLTDDNTPGLPNYNAEVLPGIYSVSETVVLGWQSPESTSCTDASSVSAINVSPGETVTCTFVNEKLAKITLVKNTLGGDGDFDFDATGTGLPADIDLTTVAGTANQTFENLDPDNTYSITENVPLGWTLVSSSCTGTNTPDAITPDSGEEIICTFTNGKLPTLTLEKTVINDNGGTATEADFQAKINDGNVAWDALQTLSPGNYTASETNLAGYSAGNWGGNCAADGTVTLAYGDTKTCTITNDDIQPKLTLIKNVTNNNGGNGLISDFPLFVDATPVISGVQNGFNASSYTVSETTLNGYTPSVWSGDCAADGSVTLSIGDVKTCEITNDDQPARITLTKIVTNNNGGNAQPDDFALTVGGNPVLSGVTIPVNSNTPHALNETMVAGYSFVSLAGDPKCPAVSGGTVTLDEGEHVSCIITNDDIAPSLTLVKEVVNDNGGDAVAGDWALTAAGYDSQSPDAGIYNLSESGPANYTQTSLTCDNAQGQVNSVTLSLGEDVTCTFVNDDDAPSLTLNKVVVNNDGGTILASSVTLTATGPTGFSGAGPTISNGASFDAGSYDLSESAVPGYSASDWDCNLGQVDENTVTVALGEDVTCTITNDDIAPKLTFIKTVINDNGGSAQVSDFPLFINGNPVTSEVENILSANVLYTAIETNLPGYTSGVWGGDCAANGTITLQPGDDKTCTITNDDQQAYIKVIKVVVNDNGGSANPNDFNLTLEGSPVLSEVLTPVNPGTYTAGETLLFGYAFNGFSGDCDVNGDVTMALGESKTCTLTNSDIAPKLHLRKVVVNDNGGTATVVDFTLTASGVGSNDLSGTSPVDSGVGLLADTWALSETFLVGYTASNWVCVGGIQNGANITVGIGEEATCTITNDDQQAYITVVKNVVNDNGGIANPNNFNITLEGSAVSSGVVVPVNPGTYTAAETLLPGYIFEGFSGDCDANGDTTVALGESKTCTLTNNDTPGHFTGGGSIFPLPLFGKVSKDSRVTHGFTLHCDKNRLPNRLEVNWGPANNAQKFHLETLTSATCSDNPLIDPEQPRAEIDTITGIGTGRYQAGKKNLVPAKIEFTFDDAGEPGRNDTAKMRITSLDGNTVYLDTGANALKLDMGNQQAHQDN